MDLEGRVVVVTGGTGELGGSVIRRYLEAGAYVAAPVRDEARAHGLRSAHEEHLAGETARLVVMAGDPGDRAAMDAVVEDTVRRWGRVDALANLAGGYDRSAPWDLEAIERSFAANVRTAIVTTAACLRPMRARGYGRIVSVGSFGANRGGRDSAGYSMSKTALVRWTESLASSLKDEGITANVVLPSIIDHPVNRREMPKADPSKWVRPDELAEVILFLSSPRSSAVTGAAIPVLGRV